MSGVPRPYLSQKMIYIQDLGKPYGLRFVRGAEIQSSRARLNRSLSGGGVYLSGRFAGIPGLRGYFSGVQATLSTTIK